jgi:hypothetical protein
MKDSSRNGETHCQVMKTMLDEFPVLKEKAEEYLRLATKL